MLAHHYDDWDNSDELLITYSIDGGTTKLNVGSKYRDVFNAPADLGLMGMVIVGLKLLPALTTGTRKLTVSSNNLVTYNCINLNNKAH